MSDSGKPVKAVYWMKRAIQRPAISHDVEQEVQDEAAFSKKISDL